MTNNEQQRPLILISNDDGYQAQGFQELVNLMRQLGDVVAVAPEGARSGVACAFTSDRPISLRTISNEPGCIIYACSGTPVDCIKVGFEVCCSRRPSLVVSGINHGDNASVSMHYSGTMGAVTEGCLKGLNAIGYSLRTLSRQCDFTPYRQAILDIARGVLAEPLPVGTCLNVNFPEVTELKGVRLCRMGRGAWIRETADDHCPRGGQYYWITGEFQALEPEAEDTDWWALNHGYASVVPITMDTTDYEFLNKKK